MRERQPYISKFKNFDTHSEMEPEEESSRRPADIEVAGVRLLEIKKSPVQQEAVGLATSYVEEYLRGLGIKSRSFDPRRITFVDYITDSDGSWNKKDDWIVLSAPVVEANIHTITHELLHAYSSEWQYKPEEEVEASSFIRPAKTGFSTAWLQHKALNTNQNFLLLNEAITEKIAREITQKHKAEITALPRKYMDTYEQRIQKAQEYIDAGSKEDLNKFEEKKALILQVAQKEIEQLRKSMKEELSEIEIKEKDPQVAEEEKKILEDHINAMIKSVDGFAKSEIQLNESWLDTNRSIRNTKTVGAIQDTWLRPTESYAYQEGIDLLELILQGLALESSAETSQSYDAVSADIWKELQVAYVNGQTVWLRKIEKTFGKGSLRAIAELAPDRFGLSRLKKKSDEVKEGLQERVAALRSKLE